MLKALLIKSPCSNVLVSRDQNTVVFNNEVFTAAPKQLGKGCDNCAFFNKAEYKTLCGEASCHPSHRRDERVVKFIKVK